MNMENTSIEARGLTKRFNERALFKEISFTLSIGHPFAVTGPNGSGKSTLLEIIAGLKSPTAGSILYQIQNDTVTRNQIVFHIGFVSPRVNPYADLTGDENIHFVSRYNTNPSELLKTFNLYEQRNKKVRFYSSGMKQRLRLIMAIINNPEILILDEPGMNLDTEGRKILFSYLTGEINRKIIIIATNDEDESQFCSRGIRLG